MSVQVSTYSIKFTVTEGIAQWAYSPSLLSTSSQISVSAGDVAILVFDIEPMQANIQLSPMAQLTNPTWPTTPNQEMPSFITVSLSPDGRTLVIMDDNTETANAGSYGFKLNINYGSGTFTSPDPIIVNRDTGGNLYGGISGAVPALTDVREDVEILEPVAAG